MGWDGHPDEAAEVHGLYADDHEDAALKGNDDAHHTDISSVWWRRAAQIYTDQQYTCPIARSARWAARSGRVPPERTFVAETTYASYQYKQDTIQRNFNNWCKQTKEFSIPGVFDFVLTNPLSHILPCPQKYVDAGAAHGDDVAFVWPALDALEGHENDRHFARVMLSWWQQFAASGNPTSVEDGLQWEDFGNANKTLFLGLDSSEGVVNNRQRFCQFWDKQHMVPYPQAVSVTAKGRAASLQLLV